LKIDASDFVIDACLYQIENEVQKFIVFWFRKLSEFEKRYEVHDKKLLVIVKHCKNKILSYRHREIYTDLY
jgi:hypothetical protein